MSILEGSVVFIDDDYQTENTHANDFYRELLDGGRPVAAYDKLPPKSHLEHWDGLALVVVDWNLRAGEERVPGATVLEESDRVRMVRFLTDLLDRYFCLVAIISTDSRDQIERTLRDSDGFPASAIGPRLKIVHKDDAQGGLINILAAEIAADPVRSILRTWDQQYQRAKNKMFIDFSGYATDWPAYIVKAARTDGVDSGYQLVETLYGNLRHRVDPVAFDIDSLDITNAEDAKAIREVEFGRRVLPGERLHKTTIMPGDFFKKWRESDPVDAIWLNLTPACYTVRGRKGQKRADVRLHLVRGLPIEVPSDGSSGASRDFERQRQAASRSTIVDLFRDGSAYKFEFSTLETFAWSTVARYRIGRLLAPFVNHVQQRHAFYLTSEGLPRVLPEMYRA